MSTKSYPIPNFCGGNVLGPGWGSEPLTPPVYVHLTSGMGAKKNSSRFASQVIVANYDRSLMYPRGRCILDDFTAQDAYGAIKNYSATMPYKYLCYLKSPIGPERIEVLSNFASPRDNKRLSFRGVDNAVIFNALPVHHSYGKQRGSRSYRQPSFDAMQTVIRYKHKVVHDDPWYVTIKSVRFNRYFTLFRPFTNPTYGHTHACLAMHVAKKRPILVRK